MIVWLLLLCTHVDNGTQCLAPIELPTKEVCVSVGNSYRELGRNSSDNSRVSAKCIAIRKSGR